MFIVLHLAGFALQAVLRAEPATAASFRDRPAALFTGTTKKSVVLTLNAAALAAGVEPGMSASQAIARCPGLLIRSPHADAEADARAALLAAAFSVGPQIEATAPGIVTIDAHGFVPAARAPACHAALARLAGLGLFATAGIARTPLLALYAARTTGNVRLLENETDFLASLSLSAADPAPEIVGILHAWGLRTLGDLTRLSRDDIGRRCGPAGTALWDRARGGDTRPLHLVPAPQEFAATMEFEDALETLDPLLFILRRFLERLTLELAAAHFVALELDLALTLADDTAHARSFRLPEPTRDLEILFRTLHTHLESVRTDSPIVSVRLRITPARPLVRQHGLFDTGLRDPHGFAETLARVVALVGSDHVGTPQLEDTHRPDAVKLVPPLAVIPPPAPAPVQPALGRPLRRFRPPLPVRFEMSDHQPTFLWTERIQGEIAARHGPWHSSGEWWQADRAWSRAEWDIALADGGVYRIFRTAEGWFLEGEYD
jgi:protein ImuB